MSSEVRNCTANVVVSRKDGVSSLAALHRSVILALYDKLRNFKTFRKGDHALTFKSFDYLSHKTVIKMYLRSVNVTNNQNIRSVYYHLII